LGLRALGFGWRYFQLAVGACGLRATRRATSAKGTHNIHMIAA